MRHGRLAATGFVTGAVLGFLAEFLRPRTARPDSSSVPNLPSPRTPATLSGSASAPLRSGRGTNR